MKISFLIATILGVVLIACGPSEIKQNMGIAQGQITGNNKDYREWSFFLNYTFKVSDTIYQGHSPLKVSGKYLNDFMYKYFPVVYSTKNPKKSAILITPEDFSGWNIQFPDSLNWVKDKIRF